MKLICFKFFHLIYAFASWPKGHWGEPCTDYFRRKPGIMTWWDAIQHGFALQELITYVNTENREFP